MSTINKNSHDMDHDRRKNEMERQNAGTQALEIAQIVFEVIFLWLQISWAVVMGIYRLFVHVPKKSIKGEIVLITGAGHGIGRELALQYASEGATVVCWDINQKGNEETVKEIANLGYPKAHAYVCNVANREEVIKLGGQVSKEIGDVTILVNNAGIMPTHAFLDHTADEIKRIMDINVMAHYWTLQAFLPAMKKNNHGHIVCLSSCAGLMGLRYLVPYCASKYAVRGIMEALREELRANPKSEIKFTTIYPYMVDTGLCKKPAIRFPNMMPILNSKGVAKFIISCQRRDIVEATIPRHLMCFFAYLRTHPLKVGELFADFLDARLESDL